MIYNYQTTQNDPHSIINYPSFSERLRPRSIDELLIPNSRIVKFNAMIKSSNVMDMIFYGSPGTGKTTCANLIASLSDLHALYVNASLTNSVNDIRDEVEKYAVPRSLFSKTRIVLLDESDYLSKNAQAALRSVIERTIGNCRFILTANVLSKIDPALQSRCIPFCFEVPLSSINESIEKLIQTIKNRLQELNLEIDESRLREIVVLKFPDYRSIANEIEFEFL